VTDLTSMQHIVRPDVTVVSVISRYTCWRCQDLVDLFPPAFIIVYGAWQGFQGSPPGEGFNVF